ncbi:MAG: hypothetical protein IJ880_02335 [Bacilli bacterium]|nr:hypothetical protein [Bacilli bacterium]
MAKYEYKGRKSVTMVCNIVKFICIIVLIVLASMGASQFKDDTGTLLVIITATFMLLPRKLFHWVMWRDEKDEEEQTLEPEQK